MAALIHRAATLAALLIVGCGLASPKDLISEGHRAIDSGNSTLAQSKFTEALKTLKPGDAQFIEARIGIAEAWIAADAKKAREEFLTLASQYPNQVEEKDFAFVGAQMLSAGKYSDAIGVLSASQARFGGASPELDALIERLKSEEVSTEQEHEPLTTL
ncbi:MAG TPA: hypothetical protein VK843_05025 [Planctomycetota bacterium]|nr:hypothetical protein [Planctomycetota bacterium]